MASLPCLEACDALLGALHLPPGIRRHVHAAAKCDGRVAEVELREHRACNRTRETSTISHHIAS